MDKKKKNKSKMNTSTKVIIVLGVFCLCFILSMIITFWVKGAVPDTLIQYTLGAGGVEAMFLAAIKITKVMTESKTQKKKEKNEDLIEEEDYHG